MTGNTLKQPFRFTDHSTGNGRERTFLCDVLYSIKAIVFGSLIQLSEPAV